MSIVSDTLKKLEEKREPKGKRDEALSEKLQGISESFQEMAEGAGHTVKEQEHITNIAKEPQYAEEAPAMRAEKLRVTAKKSQDRGKKTHRIIIVGFVIVILFIVWLILFLNKYTLKRQLGPDFKESLAQKSYEKTVAMPADEQKAVNNIEADKAYQEKKPVNTLDAVLPPDIHLGGIVTGEGDSYAIINGRIVRRGSKIDGAEIISIRDNAVTYKFANKEYTVKMW